jgi:hypothetical protein
MEVLTMKRNQSKPAEDLGVIRGAAAIGRAIGADERRAFYLLEQGIVPGRKEGGTWISTKSALQRFYDIEVK